MRDYQSLLYTRHPARSHARCASLRPRMGSCQSAGNAATCRRKKAAKLTPPAAQSLLIFPPLGRVRNMSTFPRLAFVCPMPWSAMVGDERSRFCSACRKSVTNLSVLSEDERKAVLAAARPGELCVAYQRGLEGKPVGLGSRHFPDPNLRRHAVSAVAAGTRTAAH